jgi:thiol:disulfide interchange protein
LSEKKQTRAEYQKSLQKEAMQTTADESTTTATETRAKNSQDVKREQRFNPDEQSEVKSRALAKKLNIAIAALIAGIILVFLILFFVG